MTPVEAIALSQALQAAAEQAYKTGAQQIDLQAVHKRNLQSAIDELAAAIAADKSE